MFRSSAQSPSARPCPRPCDSTRPDAKGARRRLPMQPALPGKQKMSAFKSDFLRVLDERGFIHQTSDSAGLDELAAKGEAIGYVGYDCTAPSLHIGNFLT